MHGKVRIMNRPTIGPTLHEREAERLAALARYNILDTPREQDFDDIAELASEICGTPIAVVNLVGDARQWFKAEVGLGVRETPLETSFCGHAILQEDFMLVPDATQDPRFDCNPLVVGEPGLRFYAGALLKTEDGFPIGTLCVLDYKPRELTDQQIRTLRRLARQIMTQLELRRIVRAQSESEAYFRAMADHVPAMVWVTNASGYCTYVNRRWCEFTGQTETEAQAYGWFDAIHPEEREAAEKAFFSANAAHEPFRAEYRLRRSDGTYRWVIDAASPRFDENGTYLGFVGSVLDITERKEAEQQLVETTRRLDAILNNTTMAVFMMDDRQQCAYMNKAAEGLTGYTLAETQGRPLHDVIHHTRPDGSPYPLCECPIDQAFPENNQEQGEEIFVHKDGSFYPVGFTASPIRDETGKSIGTVIEARNIEEEIRAKAALEAFNATLEQRVAEAIAEREKVEEALRQAQKMEAVGQLTGGIAHDFNNLLTGIVGSLDMLSTRISQGRTETAERYIKAAMASANRASALTHRLLAFARRQPLDPRPVQANALVASLEDLFRRTVGETVTLEVVLAGGLWPTLCDPNQLESALLNLVINARDAMPDGGKLTIETCNAHLDDAYVAAQRDIAPGQYVCICVTDTGAGMPKDVIERAFEPFFTTKPLGQGTGLGLSMVYGFARQSEGHAKIYSEVGAGTTIKLYLPRYRGETVAETEAATLAEALRAGSGETVLVVEDEPVVRSLIVEVLEDLGYRTLEAADGPAGLKLLQSKQRIDLLVTDVGLPGLNGRQLADAARERRRDLKVLFITGYAENATLAAGFLDPGMQMITKPFAVDALAQKISSIIKDGNAGT
jgi:PAS domain S-box-containing protein